MDPIPQEIQLIQQYSKAIPSSSWNINSETFSVTINSPIIRTFTQQEMQSFCHEHQYLSSVSQDCNSESTKFITQYNIAKKENKFFQFLKRKGINLYYKSNITSTDRRHQVIESFFDDHLKKSESIITISNSFGFQLNQYRVFGELLLNGKPYEGAKKRFLDYLVSTVKGQFPHDKTLITASINQYITDYCQKIFSLDYSYLAQAFTRKYLEYNKIETLIDTFLWNRMAPSNIYKSLLELEKFIRLFGSSNYSLLIANVPKPAHVYHLIQPSHFLYMKTFEITDGSQNIERVQFDQSHLLLCTENSGFIQKLEAITRKGATNQPNKGNGNADNSNKSFYILLHPENLMENELENLKMLIRTRRQQKIEPNSKDPSPFPRILIITSLPKEFFNFDNDSTCPTDCHAFKPTQIDAFARFSEALRKFDGVKHDIVLVSSDLPGAGKSYFINKAIKTIKGIPMSEKLSDEYKEYFDITTTELPISLKTKDIVHLTISPELFNNEFRLMDKFYLLMQYGYYSSSNGDIISYYGHDRTTNPIFFIEIPNLEEGNQFQEYYDFPVAPYFNSGRVRTDNFVESASYIGVIAHLINGTDTIDVGHKRIIFSNEENSITRENDPNIVQIIQSIFKPNSDITTFEKLLSKALSLFFSKDDHLNSSECYHKQDRRILSGIKKMLNSYSGFMSKLLRRYENPDECKRKRQMISICILRTILYVWHFLPSSSKSLILLVPQRLMCNSSFENKDKALFIGFPSNLDNKVESGKPTGDSKWNVDLLEELSPNCKNWINDDAFITDFLEEFKDDSNFHMLTDPLRKNTSQKNNDTSISNNEIELQSSFFDSLLLLFPEIINRSDEEIHDLEVAHLLLLLFSSGNHYENKESDALTCLKNSNTIEIAKSNINSDVKWDTVDDLVFKLFHSNVLQQQEKEGITSISDLINAIKTYFASKNLNYWNIIKMSFAKTYFCRFVELLLKITFHYFEILEGETGCGKTASINLLNALINLFRNPQYFGSGPNQINFSFKGIDLHGNYTQQNFDDDIKSQENSSNVIIFLDEINTSPAFQYIIDFILNNPTASNYSFVAAINKFVQVEPVVRMMTRVGLEQKINRKLSKVKLLKANDKTMTNLFEDYDTNQLAYNVKETPLSIKSYVVCADPTPFDACDDIFLPSEEKNTIFSIITKLLYQWEKSASIELLEVRNILVNLICDMFLFIRRFMNLREILSYRDVDRCGKVFIYVYERLMKIKGNDQNIQSNHKMQSMAISIALYISLFLRFSQTIEIKNGEQVDIDLEKRRLDERLKTIGIEIETYVDGKRINLYQMIVKNISSETKWKKYATKLPFIDDWYLCTLQFAYLKCFKYILHSSTPEDLSAPLPSLMLHLLIISLTVNITFKERNSQLYSCLIIGFPGTSKTKAYQLYKAYKLRPDAKVKYFVTSYLCSRSSDETGLETQFLNSAYFLTKDNQYSENRRAIVILEEVGLANYNPKRPLKLLHYLCDKGISLPNKEISPVIPIQISNYALDFANMNRNFLVCASLPTNEDLAAAYALRAFLSDKSRKRNSSIRADINIFRADINIFDSKDIYAYVLSRLQATKQEKFNDIYEYSLTVLRCLWQITNNSNTPPTYFPMRPLFTLLQIMNQLEFVRKCQIDNSILRHLAIVLNSFILPNVSKDNLLGDFLESIGRPHPSFSSNPNNQLTVTVTLRIYLFNFINDQNTTLYVSQYQPVLSQLEPEIQTEEAIDPSSVSYDKNGYPMIKKEKSYTFHDEKALEDFKKKLNDSIQNLPKFTEFNYQNLRNSITDYIISNNGGRYELSEIIDPILQLRAFLSDNERNCLLIRTKKYEACNFLKLLINHNDEFEIQSINFVPFESEDVVNYCQDQFEQLYRVLVESNEVKKQNENKKSIKKQVFIYIGNNPFMDYIIDILNCSNKKNASPTALSDGFPVYFPSFPSNIKFIIILNENDLYNTEKINPVPYPLIDRLDHIFIDKQILSKFSKTISSEKEKPESQILPLLDQDIYKNIDLANNPYFYNLEKSDMAYLHEALNSARGQEILQKHYDPKTYISDLDHLKSKMKNFEIQKVIVATRSPMFKDIYINEKLACQFTIDDIINNTSIADSCSADDDIVIKSDIFNNDSDYQLDYIEKMKKYIEDGIKELEKYEEKHNFFLIFFMNSNDISSKLQSSYEWPVIWIENLSNTDYERKENEQGSADNKKSAPFIQQVCETIMNNEINDTNNFKVQLYIEAAKIKSDFIAENRNPKESKDKTKEESKDSKISIKNVFNSLCTTAGIFVKPDARKKTQFSIFDIIHESDMELKQFNECHQLNYNAMDFTSLQEEIREGTNSDVNLIMRFLSKAVSGIPLSIQAMLLIILNYIGSNVTTNKNSSYQVSKTKKSLQDDIKSILHSLCTLDAQKIPYTEKDFSDHFSDLDNGYSPSIIIYSLIMKFLNQDSIYFNSLYNFPRYLAALPFEKNNQFITNVYKFLLKTFNLTKISESYLKPSSYDVKSHDICTIELFEIFLNMRGALSPDSVSVFNSSGNFDFFVKLGPEISKCETEDSIQRAEYSKMIQLDCSFDVIKDEKFPALNYRHPWVIYNHFINNPDFTFDNYKDQSNTDKSNIFDLSHIFWLLRFFMYGSIDLKSHEQLNLFITKLLKTESQNAAVNAILTPQFKNFLYDSAFQKLCRQTELTFMNDLDVEYPKPENQEFSYSESTFSMKTNKPHIDVDNFDRYNENFDIFAEYSSIQYKFKEIHGGKNSSNDKWAAKHSSKSFLDQDPNVDILSTISEKILHANPNLDDEFPKWLLNSKHSLLVRQVYITLKRIDESCNSPGDEAKKKEAEREYLVFKKIVNPWNDQCNYPNYVYSSILHNINGDTFSSIENFKRLFNKLNFSYIRPYYFCTNEGQPYIIQEINISTYSIPRMLFENAMEPEKVQDTNKLKNVFRFFRYLPFCHYTEHLYILSAFVHKLIGHDIFQNQLNLLYLVFISQAKCTTLLNIPNMSETAMKPVIDDLKSKAPLDIKDPNCTSLLEQALQQADKFGKGSNALEKLTFYVNKLINVNNKTILSNNPIGGEMYRPFRLIFKKHLHSNLSIRNTFIPALAHLNENALSLLNAYDILTAESKDIPKELISDEILAMKYPTLTSNTDIIQNCMSYFRLIDHSNILGFPEQLVLNSLGIELAQYIYSHQKDNPEDLPTRYKILQNVLTSDQHYEDSQKDSTRMLETLIAIFAEYDTDFETNLKKFVNTSITNSFRTPGIEPAIEFIKTSGLIAIYNNELIRCQKLNEENAQQELPKQQQKNTT